VGDDQLLPDLRAGGVTSLGRLRQGDPRPDQQRLDGSNRNPERLRELGVADPAQLSHQQGGSLLVRQPPDISDQPSERFSAVALRDRIVNRVVHKMHRLGRWRAGAPELIHAPVVGNSEEPCSQREIAIARAQRPVGTDKDVLEHVLGVLT
jgi:hypothetical protein